MATLEHKQQTFMVTNSFWNAINILVTKPHVVNKRLWGTKIILKTSCSSSLPLDITLTSIDLRSAEEIGQFITSRLADHTLHNAPSNEIEVTLVELLPKNYMDPHAFQLVTFDKINDTVTFYDVSLDKKHSLCPEFAYSLQLKRNEIVFKALCDKNSNSYQWLVKTVLPQFVKWGEEPFSKNDNICNESLSLISIDKYYNKYNELKLKYGKEMVQIWPECTDPSKFVYEDVAIATYLLLLWEDERKHLKEEKLQTFVDLGCGNGLLVYILAMEGHNGLGIDVRKRHIWDLYPTNVKLEEKTIAPSDDHLFPDTDWIIGNHSDELTPWIPVIAARSSYKCNFFLLPCCAYNFDGTKYQRQNSSKSIYIEYLQHINDICKTCGFSTDVDRLKIPSTKRICVVGRGRIHSYKEYDEYCEEIQGLINTEETSEKQDKWIKDFKPRDPVERVRNCTQIDKSLIESIVNSITKYLLDDEILSESMWSLGRKVEINRLVQLIPQVQLKSLKSECGGLQTLLKNNHHIFEVLRGKVQLRYPKTIDEVKNSSKVNRESLTLKIKQRPCWFYSNHPHGCPLKDTECSYSHNKI